MVLITTMDMPETCGGCGLCGQGVQGGRVYPWYCHAQHRALSPAVETKRDKGCPLAPPGLIRDEDLQPPEGETVLIARTSGKAADLRIEEGVMTAPGTYKVKGANVKKIIGWLPLPDTKKE